MKILSTDIANNQAYWSNLSFITKINSDGTQIVNITLLQKADFLTVTFFITLKGKTNENSEKYDQTWVRGSIDACKLENGFANFFIKLMVESFKDHTNYTKECPIKKGFYCSMNVSFDIGIIPPQFLGRSRAWEFTAIGKANVPNVKSKVQFTNFKAFGII